MEPQCRLPGVLAHRCISSIHKVGFEVPRAAKAHFTLAMSAMDHWRIIARREMARFHALQQKCAKMVPHPAPQPPNRHAWAKMPISLFAQSRHGYSPTRHGESRQPKSQTKRLTSRAKCVRLGSPATMSFALPAARLSKRVKRSAVK